ncbi:MAG: hypothetical protein ACRDJB_08395 [Actinomycetota bacterium]
MRAIVVALTTAVLCNFTGPGLAAEVQLEGIVHNGTEGRGLPADLEINAVQTSSLGSEVDRATVEVSRAGHFSLPPMDARRAERVVVSVRYKGVSYRTTAELGTGSRPIRLTIFEPTRDASVITVRSDTSVATLADDDELAVLHLLRVDNDSDRTYIGEASEGRPAVLRLPLPSRAFDLRALEGLTHEAITDIDGGVASGDPLQPGETRMSFSYGVLGGDAGWALGHPVHYPTTRADVLVQPDLFVRAPGRHLGSLDFDGRRYRQFEFGPLLEGQVVAVSVTAPRSSTPWMAWTFAALLAVAAAVAIRRRRSQAQPATPVERELLPLDT